MDIETLINNPEHKKLGDEIGLYIISQTGLAPPFHTGYYRCGAAGISERRDEPGQSSLRSRAAMYLNSWVTGGRVHAFVTVPRSIFSESSERVLQLRVQGDAREDYQLAGKTRLRVREKEYHVRLDTNPRIERVRGGRAEWFKGNLRDITRELRAIGTGHFYRFDDNQIVEDTVLTRAQDLGVTRHKHRRSPRLENVELRVTREIRELITRSPELLGQLATAASNPRVKRIVVSKKIAGDVSSRTRSKNFSRV